MIRSRKELDFYIKADTYMNRGYFKPSLKERLKKVFVKDDIMVFLRYMRKCQYYSQWGGVFRIYSKWCNRQYHLVGRRLGFSIGFNVFGYGLVIPHYGTIVVGGSNKCGNYCVLHTSTCISDNGKQIGDAFYLSTGAKVTTKVIIGDNVSVGANSVLNKSFPEGNVMVAGAPAKIIKPEVAWYIRDGKTYQNRVDTIEKYKREIGL